MIPKINITTYGIATHITAFLNLRFLACFKANTSIKACQRFVAQPKIIYGIVGFKLIVYAVKGDKTIDGKKPNAVNLNSFEKSPLPPNNADKP